jgi:hypothetical protein
MKAVFVLLIACFASACGAPRCPPGYAQKDDFCRKCKPGTVPKSGECVPEDGSSEGDPGRANDLPIVGVFTTLGEQPSTAAGAHKLFDNGFELNERTCNGRHCAAASFVP